MVVIKDMDMPKKCQECDFECEAENYYGDTMYFYCPYIYKGYTDDFRDSKRHEECPLSVFELCEDVISRQAAIDAVLDAIPYDEYWFEQVNKAIDALPSAYHREICSKEVQQ